jgi:tRNA (guanine-N7-)-methyltransferase
MSGRHADAMAELWPIYGLTVVDGDRSPLDLGVLFGREAPRVLEIGFGMGDTTAAMAATDPERDYLAVEVHTPGIGNLLALIGESGLTNVRVAHGDAMQLVHRLAPGSLDAINIFFPDPWPKARHHKRRLIQPANVALLRERLRVGGVLHCATDWPDYARSMAETLAADPGLRNATDDPTSAPLGHNPGAQRDATTPPEHDPGPRDTGNQADGTGRGWRPVTKFERRGAEAGRPIVDLVFCRHGGDSYL